MNEELQLQRSIIEAVGTRLFPETSLNIFRQKLADYIHELIDKDFDKLILILYRLDVSEKKLKSLLANSSSDDAGVIISDLIIERQLQKIQTRRQFRKSNEDIPDDEKW